MEIDINIKLEDTDIAILIKVLWEILKKIPQDNVNIKIDPNSKPPTEYPKYEPPRPYTPDTSIKYTGTTTTDKIYYSDNGKSVKELDNEKKNEVDLE